jgi:hypothetical protein
MIDQIRKCNAISGQDQVQIPISTVDTGKYLWE